MKRCFLTILLFLLLGLLANVAVAWGCAMLVEKQRRPNLHSDLSDEEVVALWDDRRPAVYYHNPVYIDEWSGGGLRCVTLHSFSGSSPVKWPSSKHLFVCGRTVTYAGWPIHSLWGSTWFRTDAPATRDEIVEYHHHAAMLVGSNHTLTSLMMDQSLVPFAPLWPGFALNSVFYATFLWLLVPGPFALRRFIRRKRGQCPACGYPVGDSAVCSECGKELPKGVRAT